MGMMLYKSLVIDWCFFSFLLYIEPCLYILTLVRDDIAIPIAQSSVGSIDSLCIYTSIC